MADISSLSQNPVEQLDLANYKDVKESTGFVLPEEGVYTLQAPATFSFKDTKNGDLSATISPSIVGPTNPGFEVRYIDVSAKVFDRDGEKVSWLGDYLRACGFRGRLSTKQEQADAVESTANLQYKAKLVWEAENRRTGFKLKGMKKFPKNEDGTYQSWVEDPTEKDDQGNPVRVFARLRIDRFYAA